MWPAGAGHHPAYPTSRRPRAAGPGSASSLHLRSWPALCAHRGTRAQLLTQALPAALQEAAFVEREKPTAQTSASREIPSVWNCVPSRGGGARGMQHGSVSGQKGCVGASPCRGNTGCRRRLWRERVERAGFVCCLLTQCTRVTSEILCDIQRFWSWDMCVTEQGVFWDMCPWAVL